jgi:tetratricopeptide (TPR) repeat protein
LAPSSTRYSGLVALRPLLAAVLLGCIGVVPVAGAEGPADTGDEHGYSRAELASMARAGAPGLALELMDEAQPGAGERPQGWLEWERLRLRLLAEGEAWQRALDRIAGHPEELSRRFRRWVQYQRATFHLERREAANARAVLRRLIWEAGDGEVAREWRRAWRRALVRSYLVADAVGDAVTAMRRFDQDFSDASEDWTRLRARVLLRAGRPAEARERIPGEPSGELAALALLAELRSEASEPKDVWQDARRAAEADETAPADKARFWFVAAEAAPGPPAGRALATERAAHHAAALPAGESLFRVNGDDLWSAWLAYGRWYANEHELLIGDDAAWFAAARAAWPRYAVRARALLAVVAQQGTPVGRRRAHDGLVARARASDVGMALVRQAYLHSQRYPDAGDIPALVRHELVSDALERDDVELATRLLADMEQAPPGIDTLSWGLTRARVLVLGGRGEAGFEGLKALLARFPRLSGERLDRFLQVVFDLQGGDYHAQALTLLRHLARREPANQRKREVLYWQAESHEARERYRRAAELYMRSATLIDGRAGDQWGQTARYHAAAMLAQAGLVGDARRIYRTLLEITDDEQRAATLRRRLQKLGLRRPDSANLPAEPEPR